MPTLAELVDGAYRDLADEAKAVFSTLQVEDFVRGGIAELNRVSPSDTVYDLPLNADPDTGLVTAPWSYPVPISHPYAVEVIRLTDGYRWSLSSPVDGYVDPVGGYAFRVTPDGGVIDFPQWYLQQFDATAYGIRISGYASRDLPYTTDPDPSLSPPVPLSSEEEYSVRGYAKSAGFDLLAHDRSLFAQWQVQTSNSDVSPTQMMQMAANAKGDWDRQRSLIRTVRRDW